MVFVNVDLQGTSNSTAATFTLPYALGSSAFAVVPLMFTANSGTFTIGGYAVISGSTATIWRWTNINSTSSSWTASGTKIATGQFFYEIN